MILGFGLGMMNTEMDSCDADASNEPTVFELRDARTCTIRAWTEDDAAQLVSVMPKMTAESDFLGYMAGEFNMTVAQEVEFIRNHHAKPQS